MSLPLQAVDRLFARLQATYGRDFTSKYEGIEIGLVKSSWAHELAGFAGQLGSIAWALENLPDRAPNVIEFRAICRRAPAADVPRIEHSPAGKARIEEELKKLGPNFRERAGRSGGNKEWAPRLIRAHEDGQRSRSSAPLQMARQALGLAK